VRKKEGDRCSSALTVTNVEKLIDANAVGQAIVWTNPATVERGWNSFRKFLREKYVII